jgi:hypothetical protein
VTPSPPLAFSTDHFEIESAALTDAPDLNPSYGRTVGRARIHDSSISYANPGEVKAAPRVPN